MKHTIIAINIIMLIGCSMTPLGYNVVRDTPSTVKDGSKKIFVMKIVDTVSLNSVVGKGYRGGFCVRSGDLFWTGNENVLNSMTNIVRTRLDKYGYTLVGKTHSPFNDEYSKQSEILLGGKLLEIKSNACKNFYFIKGEVYMKVEWEIYDKITNSIVLNVSTEGYSSRNEFEIGDMGMYEQAIEMAIDNLLSDDKFYALLTTK